MKILKNFMYSTVYQIFSIIIPLITAPYLARVLGAENLGIFSYVSSVSSLFSTIGLIGLTNYSCREIAFVREDKDLLTKTFFELVILRIILLIVTIFLFIITAYWFENPVYKIYYLFQIIWLASTFLDVSWFFNGIEDFKTTVLKNVFVKMVTIVLIFAFVNNKNTLSLYFILNGVSQLLGVLTFIPNLKKNILVKKYKLEIMKHIKPSFKLFLPQVAGILYLQMDKIMLKNLCDSNAIVSYYDQSEKIIKIPLALITALSSVMLPRVANSYQKNKKSIKKYIDLSIKFSLLLAYPMTFGIAAIAANFIPWFLGNEFLSCINTIIFLSPIIILISLSSISSSQYFIVTGNTKILTFSYVASAIVNLIFNYFAIPILGVFGAAFGTVLAEGTAVVIHYYYMNKDIKILNSICYSFRYLFYSLIMFVIVKNIDRFLHVSIISTAIEVIIGILIYVICLYLTKDKILKEVKQLD